MTEVSGSARNRRKPSFAHDVTRTVNKHRSQTIAETAIRYQRSIRTYNVQYSLRCRHPGDLEHGLISSCLVVAPKATLDLCVQHPLTICQLE